MLLAGPMAYAIDTMQTGYSGGDPAAGPTADQTGGPGGGQSPQAGLLGMLAPLLSGGGAGGSSAGGLLGALGKLLG